MLHFTRLLPVMVVAPVLVLFWVVLQLLSEMLVCVARFPLTVCETVAAASGGAEAAAAAAMAAGVLRVIAFGAPVPAADDDEVDELDEEVALEDDEDEEDDEEEDDEEEDEEEDVVVDEADDALECVPPGQELHEEPMAGVAFTSGVAAAAVPPLLLPTADCTGDGVDDIPSSSIDDGPPA